MRSTEKTLDDLELFIHNVLVDFTARNFLLLKNFSSCYFDLILRIAPYAETLPDEDLNTLDMLIKKELLMKNDNVNEKALTYIILLKKLVLQDKKLKYIDAIKNLYQFALENLLNTAQPNDPQYSDIFFVTIVTIMHDIMQNYPSHFEANFTTPEAKATIAASMLAYQKNKSVADLLQKCVAYFSLDPEDKSRVIIANRYPLETCPEQTILKELFAFCKKKDLCNVMKSYLSLSEKISQNLIIQIFWEPILHSLIGNTIPADIDMIKEMLQDKQYQNNASLEIISIILLSLPIPHEEIIAFIQHIPQEFYNEEYNGDLLKQMEYLLGGRKYEGHSCSQELITLVLTTIAKKSQTLKTLNTNNSIIRAFLRMSVGSTLEIKGDYDEQWNTLYEKMRNQYDTASMLNVMLLLHSNKIIRMITGLGRQDFFYCMNQISNYLQFFNNPENIFFTEDGNTLVQHLAQNTDSMLAHWKYIADAPDEFRYNLIELNQQDIIFIRQYIALVDIFNKKNELENITWQVFAQENSNAIRSLFEILGPKAIDFMCFFIQKPVEGMEKSFGYFYISRLFSVDTDIWSRTLFIIKEVFSKKKYQNLAENEIMQWLEIYKYLKLLCHSNFPETNVTAFIQQIKPLLQNSPDTALVLLKEFPLNFFSSFYADDMRNNFLSLHEKFCRINEQHDNAFQKRDPIQFLITHNKKIVMLVDIMGAPALKWLSDQITKTVLSLEILLNELPILPKPICDFLKHYFLMHKDDISTREKLSIWKGIMIGINAHYDYVRSSISELQGNDIFKEFFVEYQRHTDMSIGDFSTLCRHLLFNAIIKAMEITEEEASKIDSDALFSILSPTQFAQLAAAKFKISNTDDGRVLHALLNCYLKGASIHTFLHDTQQASPLGQELAMHNMRIQKILTERGIKTKEALAYSKTYEFTLRPKSFDIERNKILAMENLCSFLHKLCDKPLNMQQKNPTETIIQYLQNKRSKIIELSEEASDIQILSEQQKKIEGIIKKLSYMQKQNKQIFKDQKKPMELYKPSHWAMFMTIQKILQDVMNASDVVDTKDETRSFFEFAQHYQNAYQQAAAKKDIVIPKTDQLDLQHFRIEQWDKEKITTLFLGNEVGCCLAVGDFQFSAIVQRIMDDAIQFHVVVDLNTQKPIALTWLYFGKDINNEIYLVANFIEINAKYGLNDYARETIVNALLYFSGEYCNDVNIKQFIINQLMYGYSAGKIDYFTKGAVSLTDKVGGAFIPTPTRNQYTDRNLEQQTHTCDRYYLVSLRQSWFHVYSPEALTPEQRAAFAPTEKSFSPGTARDALFSKPGAYSSAVTDPGKFSKPGSGPS